MDMLMRPIIICFCLANVVSVFLLGPLTIRGIKRTSKIAIQNYIIKLNVIVKFQGL